jgi:hypothetical protein
MNIRYLNGKIYKIVSNVTGDVYYGSTIKSLKQRLSIHKSKYKRYLKGKGTYVTSFKILETGNYDIHLVEAYTCLCRSQLEAIERVYIEGYSCINMKIPTRTHKAYMKVYRKNNRDKIMQWKKKKFNCPCGGKYTRCNKVRHMRSKKHINYHK